MTSILIRKTISEHFTKGSKIKHQRLEMSFLFPVFLRDKEKKKKKQQPELSPSIWMSDLLIISFVDIVPPLSLD